MTESFESTAGRLKITPEILLLLTPITFIAGNWYLSAFSLLFVFAFLMIRNLAFRDHQITIPNHITWLMILIWGLYIAYITPKPSVAAKYYACTIFIPFIIFIIFDNIRLSDKILIRFVDALLISGMILSMYSMFLFVQSGMRSGIRVPSFWNDYNILAAYLMILFMFNLSFILKTGNSPKKLFYLITIILILSGIYFTQTRGVWLSMIISLAVFFIKRPKIIIPVSILFGLIILLFYNIIEERLLSVVYFEQDKSSLGRMQAWLSSLLIIEKNPMMGFGFDTYYLYRDDVMSYFIVDVPHPHNTYLRSILEMGLIGAVLYYLLIFKAVYYSFNFRNYVSNPVFTKYLDALQLSFVALLIAFNFEPYLSLFGGSTAAVWILVALTFRIRKEARLEKQSAS